MWRKRLLLLVGALLLIAATLSLIGHLTNGGTFTASIGLNVLRCDVTNVVSYTETLSKDKWHDAATPTLRLTSSPPDGATQVQTNAAAVLARMRLRNTGTQPLAYHSAGRPIDFTCRVQRAGEWAYLSYYYFTGMTQLLGVGESLDFTVALPPDAAAWQLQFRFENVIPKKPRIEALFGRGWWRLVPSPFLNGLADGQSHTNVQSDVFSLASIQPHNQHLQPTPR